MKVQTSRTITKNVAPLNTRPAIRRFTLSVNIRKYITDSSGVVLAPASVPASFRKNFPVHLFGEYDRQSGYAIADVIAREIESVNLFGVYVWGVNTPLFKFSNGIATINTKFKKGDVIFVYVDDIEAPNYFAFVTASIVSPVGGYASLVSLANVTQLDDNGHWGAFKFFDIQYSWVNDEQLYKPIYLVKTRFDGGYHSDSIDPAAFKLLNFEEKTVQIPLEVLLNQYVGLTTFIAWENELLTLAFNLYI